jgi:hypothetical protein
VAYLKKGAVVSWFSPLSSCNFNCKTQYTIAAAQIIMKSQLIVFATNHDSSSNERKSSMG